MTGMLLPLGLDYNAIGMWSFAPRCARRSAIVNRHAAVCTRSNRRLFAPACPPAWMPCPGRAGIGGWSSRSESPGSSVPSRDGCDTPRNRHVAHCHRVGVLDRSCPLSVRLGSLERRVYLEACPFEAKRCGEKGTRSCRRADRHRSGTPPRATAVAVMPFARPCLAAEAEVRQDDIIRRQSSLAA